ncbi:MAG: hypothetical protein GEU79_19270, partial [Acidimicrobiia bacterium]|nr:hypothetical protein [Acidimicrobiia bacterium]
MRPAALTITGVKILTRILSGIAIGLVVVVVVGLATWQIDTRRQESQVMRGVTIRGIQLGGASADGIGDRLAPLVDQIENSTVTITSDGDTFEIPVGELGVSVDVEGIQDQALASRRGGGALEDLRSWVDSFQDETSIPLQWSLDRQKTRQRLLDEPAFASSRPVEPSLSLSNGTIRVDRGQPGRRVNIDAAANDFASSYQPFNTTAIEVTTRTVPRKLKPQTLVKRKERIEGILKQGLRVEVGDETTNLTSNVLRDQLVLKETGNGEVIRFQGDGLMDRITDSIDGIIVPAEDPRFDIVDGEPVVTEEGTVPQVCCAEGSQKLVLDALNKGERRVLLQTRPSDDERHRAFASGELVTERVSTFTTEHACCESRVTNIHRFADLMQGVYLNPGESVSLNGHVGERTEE